jgi:hypothetical protein
MSSAETLKVLDVIQGSSFAAVRDALKVIQHRRLDLAKYKVQILRDDGSLVVVFSERNGTANIEKELGVRQGSEEELKAAELHALTSRTGEVTVVDTVQGSSLQSIQTAAAVFQRHNPDLSQYKITVMSDRGSIVVVFTDKRGKPGTRGNPGVLPGFEVALDPHDLRVLRSSFIR